MQNRLMQTATRAPAAPRAPAGQIMAKNAFGVPVMSPRVSIVSRGAGQAYRRAGDAEGDASQAITDWQNAHPGETVPDSMYAALDAAIGGTPGTPYAPGMTDSNPTGLDANGQTQADRDNTARQNAALIGAAGTLMGGIATAISTAISSGNQVEIQRYRTEALDTAARYQNEYNMALASGRQQDAALAQQRAQTAANMANVLQQQQINASAANTKYLLFGGLAIAGLVGLYLVTQGKGGSKTRRNPSEWESEMRANPVMQKRGKGKVGKSGRRGKGRMTKKYVPAREEARYRARGWSRAR